MPMSRLFQIGFLWIGLLLFLACSSERGRQASGEFACADSLRGDVSRPYSFNTNLIVLSDTLWLHQLPFRDSLPVFAGNELVVAEFSNPAADSMQVPWVKVARDQDTMGWVKEPELLSQVVPVDPISRCIHWFSRAHTLPFFLILAVFFVWYMYRTARKKQIKLLGINDIDSIFPVLLSVLFTTAAVLYNTIQHYMPHTWEFYYYHPTLNPFELPFVLGGFITCIWLILLVGIAMLDDLFHQTTAVLGLFYLLGLSSCCIFLYIIFTSVWVVLAWIGWAVQVWMAWRYLRSASANYPYACGNCGAKMRVKGICPHCGAVNR